jgi:hypothetical protein
VENILSDVQNFGWKINVRRGALQAVLPIRIEIRSDLKLFANPDRIDVK